VTALIRVENLRIGFPSEGGGYTEAVKGVSFTVGQEKLGIVGESGSGKSLSSRAIMGVLPSYARVSAAVMQFKDIDLLTASASVRRGLRGGRMGMILQDPKFSLNPVMRIGKQITEALYIGNPSLSRAIRRKKALEILETVHIRAPERVFDLYPHELSGGMGQRVMIAMMVVREPELLIADEPTSALDVSVQAQVLDIMDELVSRRGMGLIFISHDLNLVARFCDRILVMYAGAIVETLLAGQLHQAQHPYTRGLLACLPSIDGPLTPLPVLERNAQWAGAGS
jgi:peptide/nickel transport system ATP-binding protein